MKKAIKGWEGIGPEAGKFVAAEDGFTYAARECGILVFNHTKPGAQEFAYMLVEWFFSGNWIEVCEDG